MEQHGKFIISLDFELLWGVRDKRSIATYGDNIKNVHTVIPRLLEEFTRHNIKGTFAIVGFLFLKNKQDLLENIPGKKPGYADQNLSPYHDEFDKIEDPAYYFAPELIKLIAHTPGQEIGTHTYSHYYTLENGQNISEFEDDLKMAIKVAADNDISFTSIVFPRNQYNDAYLEVCKKAGLICYRGNELSWIYEPRNSDKESLIRRGVRLLDVYVNITGHHTFSDVSVANKDFVNIPASRFLRPYSRTLSFLDKWRLRRIKTGMLHAATHNSTYHLWWHPHNFGNHIEENIAFLGQVLSYYNELNIKYGFISYTMTELAKKIQANERQAV
ncbi:MAG: polysaccharide deacetylase family protein [Ferruginibacter sp.]